MFVTTTQVKAACNDLEDLPRDIVKMKALVDLDVSDNVIESLPQTLCKMTSLRQLNVADNRIMEFPAVRRITSFIKHRTSLETTMPGA